ncbi:MAG: epoxyqueuosine reductase QueH, partial [Candidatus Margulisbacteria bacterium]|nr:epoxyqueuosine reductase QueH [Candidatus Margulisiibacteriota bacterium]
MKILVHTDSAFNSLFYTRWLKDNKWEIIGYFNNPYIQPYAEYKRCLMMQKLLGVLEDLIMIYAPNYNFEEYLKGISAYDKQQDRCLFCYNYILDKAAKYAKKLDIPFFTTSWLINPHHDHKLLKKVGDEVGNKYGLKFLFQD